MLIDDPSTMLDLLLENLIRGKIKFDFDGVRSDSKILDSAIEDRDKLRAWYKMRRANPKPNNYDEFAVELCDSLIHWRTIGVIQGELHDIVSEQRIKQLEQEKSELIEIASDQKKKLDGLYIESPDKKNIRGII